MAPESPSHEKRPAEIGEANPANSSDGEQVAVGIGNTTLPATRESATGFRGASPVAMTDETDPGDETQRNYRYQAAVGAILLLAMRAGNLRYEAVWCEQWEDFLGEYADGTFDAVQVKTATPENGAWEGTTTAFYKSMRRFALLTASFAGRFRKFFFISNVDYFDTEVDAKKHLSIPKLIAGVNASANQAAFDATTAKSFALLLVKINADLKDDEKVSADDLIAVLTRLRIQKGPSRDDVHDSICQSHLARLPSCANAIAKQLSIIAKRLVARVLEASSIHVEAGERHYTAFLEDALPPELQAKRLTSLDLDLILSEQKLDMFRYDAALTSLTVGTRRSQSEDTYKLQAKLKQGGLPEESVVILHRQSISAEQRLLDLVSRTEHGLDIYSQLENVVRSECNAAMLTASSNGETSYGKKMLLETYSRLRSVSRDEARRVSNESADMLLGIAALLTGQCHIWWSERFEIPPQP